MLWFAGRLHEGHTVPFDLSDRGLLLADGLFETMPCVDGHAIWADRHLARMADGAAVLGIPFDAALAAQALSALVSTDTAPGALRLTLTRGPAPRGLRLPVNPAPTLFATRAPWRADGLFQPVRLATSRIRRNSTSPTARLKTLAYLDGVMALAQAQGAGADDALMLNEAGRVACTSAGNLFVIVDGELITPPLSEGVLAGITRALLLELAARAGLVPVERPLLLADLHAARRVYTTNSLRFLTPINAVDGVPLASSLSAADEQALRALVVPPGLRAFIAA
jgi:branched-chain amino acid aminotransferase